jgi:hypothetical protein
MGLHMGFCASPSFFMQQILERFLSSSKHNTTATANLQLFDVPSNIPDESEHSFYSYGGLRLSIYDNQKDSPWKILQNPAFTVLLDGHFYLTDSPTLDPEENLNAFLHKISVTTVEKGLKSIAGGVFSLVVLDKERHEMWVTGDQFGWMPVYFYEDDAGFYLSANPFSFRKIAPLSDEAMVEFLKYGYLPFAPSLFVNVNRRLPGQLLKYNFKTGKLHITNPEVFEFPPPTTRSKIVEAAAQKLHELLIRYFSRVTEKSLALLLQNDVLSLLMLCHLKELPLNVYVAKGSENLALLAAKYGKTIRQMPFNTENWLNNFSSDRSRLPVSLENRHHQLYDFSEKFLFLNHLGSGILADGIFAEGDFQHRTEVYQDSPIREIGDYQHRLYHQHSSLSDNDLSGILSKAYEVWFLNEARGILERNRLAGHSHEDFCESLHLYTETRSLEINRLLTSGKKQIITNPLTDYEFLTRCLNLDRSLKVRHIVWDYYFLTYYPEAHAYFRKILTNQNLAVFNLQKIRDSIKKLMDLTVIATKKNQPEGTKAYDAISDEIKKYAEQYFVKRSGSGMLPYPKLDEVYRTLRDKKQKNQLNTKLLVRYVTLHKLLND